jgi:hypothetical protein
MTFLATSGEKPGNARRSAVLSSGGHVAPISSMSHSGTPTHRRAVGVFPRRMRKRPSAMSTSRHSRSRSSCGLRKLGPGSRGRAAPTFSDLVETRGRSGHGRPLGELEAVCPLYPRSAPWHWAGTPVARNAWVRFPNPSAGYLETMNSKWSLGSRNSLLSIGSDGSILSVGSVGSILSVGSIGSAGSVLSIGSAGSLASILSAGARSSLLSAGTKNAALGRSMSRWHAWANAAAFLAVGGALLARELFRNRVAG